MVITAIIVVVSGALFVYWFRSTVHLILSAADSRSLARDTDVLAACRQLYGEVRFSHLPLLFGHLQKEYRVAQYLHWEAARRRSEGTMLEGTVLRLNFRLITCLFPALRRLRPEAARAALAEMSATVEYLSRTAAGPRLELHHSAR